MRRIIKTAARPSMAPIQNLLAAWRSSLTRLDRSSLPALRSAAADTARDGIRQSKQAMVRVVENAAEYIGSGKIIVSHSLSSTVLGVIERLKDRNIRVIATESRPLNEGYILARRLSEWGVSIQLINDPHQALDGQNQLLQTVLSKQGGPCPPCQRVAGR